MTSNLYHFVSEQLLGFFKPHKYMLSDMMSSSFHRSDVIHNLFRFLYIYEESWMVLRAMLALPPISTIDEPPISAVDGLASGSGQCTFIPCGSWYIGPW